LHFGSLVAVFFFIFCLVQEYFPKVRLNWKKTLQKRMGAVVVDGTKARQMQKRV
jgi:uncharacterized membrane protein YagU involved in acid resistance